MTKILWISPCCVHDFFSEGALQTRNMLRALSERGANIVCLSSTIRTSLEPHTVSPMVRELIKQGQSKFHFDEQNISYIYIATKSNNLLDMTTIEQSLFLDEVTPIMCGMKPDLVIASSSDIVSMACLNTVKKMRVPTAFALLEPPAPNFYFRDVDIIFSTSFSLINKYVLPCKREATYVGPFTQISGPLYQTLQERFKQIGKSLAVYKAEGEKGEPPKTQLNLNVMPFPEVKKRNIVLLYAPTCEHGLGIFLRTVQLALKDPAFEDTEFAVFETNPSEFERNLERYCNQDGSKAFDYKTLKSDIEVYYPADNIELVISKTRVLLIPSLRYVSNSAIGLQALSYGVSIVATYQDAFREQFGHAAQYIDVAQDIVDDINLAPTAESCQPWFEALKTAYFEEHDSLYFWEAMVAFNYENNIKRLAMALKPLLDLKAGNNPQLMRRGSLNLREIMEAERTAQKRAAERLLALNQDAADIAKAEALAKAKAKAEAQARADALAQALARQASALQEDGGINIDGINAADGVPLDEEQAAAIAAQDVDTLEKINAVSVSESYVPPQEMEVEQEEYDKLYAQSVKSIAEGAELYAESVKIMAPIVKSNDEDGQSDALEAQDAAQDELSAADIDNAEALEGADGAPMADTYIQDEQDMAAYSNNDTAFNGNPSYDPNYAPEPTAQYVGQPNPYGAPMQGAPMQPTAPAPEQFNQQPFNSSPDAYYAAQAQAGQMPYDPAYMAAQQQANNPYYNADPYQAQAMQMAQAQQAQAQQAAYYGQNPYAAPYGQPMAPQGMNPQSQYANPYAPPMQQPQVAPPYNPWQQQQAPYGAQQPYGAPQQYAAPQGMPMGAPNMPQQGMVNPWQQPQAPYGAPQPYAAPQGMPMGAPMPQQGMVNPWQQPQAPYGAPQPYAQGQNMGAPMQGQGMPSPWQQPQAPYGVAQGMAAPQQMPQQPYAPMPNQAMRPNMPQHQDMHTPYAPVAPVAPNMPQGMPQGAPQAAFQGGMYPQEPQSEPYRAPAQFSHQFKEVSAPQVAPKPAVAPKAPVPTKVVPKAVAPQAQKMPAPQPPKATVAPAPQTAVKPQAPVVSETVKASPAPQAPVAPSAKVETPTLEPQEEVIKESTDPNLDQEPWNSYKAAEQEQAQQESTQAEAEVVAQEDEQALDSAEELVVEEVEAKEESAEDAESEESDDFDDEAEEDIEEDEAEDLEDSDEEEDESDDEDFDEDEEEADPVEEKKKVDAQTHAIRSQNRMSPDGIKQGLAAANELIASLLNGR